MNQIQSLLIVNNDMLWLSIMNGFHLFDHKFIMVWVAVVVVSLAFTSCEDSNMIVLMGNGEPQEDVSPEDSCGPAKSCNTDADCGNRFTCRRSANGESVCREQCSDPGLYRCRCNRQEQCLGDDEAGAYWSETDGCGLLMCSDLDSGVCIKPVCDNEEKICVSRNRMYVCKDGEFVDAECKGICIVTKQRKAKCVDEGDKCEDVQALRCDGNQMSIEECRGRSDYHWAVKWTCGWGQNCEYLYSEEGARIDCALPKCEFNTYQCNKSHHEVQFCKGNAWITIANCHDAKLKCIDGDGIERAHCGQ